MLAIQKSLHESLHFAFSQYIPQQNVQQMLDITIDENRLPAHSPNNNNVIDGFDAKAEIIGWLSKV